MYKFKTFNNISEQALSLLTKAKFEYDDIEPDAILVRSHTLINYDFNKKIPEISFLYITPPTPGGWQT